MKLCNDPRTYEEHIGKPNFKSAKIINGQLVGVEMKYSAIKINKPFYIGLSILDLSKWHMYNFHYNVMKPTFGERINLLYTNTDSLMYEIESEDVYKELGMKASGYFDFSNYPEDHFLKSNLNKKVPGKFKDKCGGVPIEEFVGLRSKMYSFKVASKKVVSKVEIKTAKGVNKTVILNDLKFLTYLNCLQENKITQHEYRYIHSMGHVVETYTQCKVTLSPFDDKRFLLDFINLVPYGHYFCKS